MATIPLVTAGCSSGRIPHVEVGTPQVSLRAPEVSHHRHRHHHAYVGLGEDTMRARAWLDGAAAWVAQQPLSSNPYFGPRSDQWILGYYSAESESRGL